MEIGTIEVRASFPPRMYETLDDWRDRVEAELTEIDAEWQYSSVDGIDWEGVYEEYTGITDHPAGNYVIVADERAARWWIAGGGWESAEEFCSEVGLSDVKELIGRAFVVVNERLYFDE